MAEAGEICSVNYLFLGVRHRYSDYLRLVRRLLTSMGDYGREDAKHLLRGRPQLAMAGENLVPRTVKLDQGEGTGTAPQTRDEFD